MEPKIRSVKCRGPFLATRIWNGVTHEFTNNVPRKTHRRVFKLYENCFSGSTACDVMLYVLKTCKLLNVTVTKIHVGEIRYIMPLPASLNLSFFPLAEQTTFFHVDPQCISRM